MQLSYWEIKNWFSNIDFTIVGSGIVGLHTALALRERFPSSKILVLEKGILPQGASTKNAGFACFGSISEIIDDLKTHTEEEVIQTLHDLKDAKVDVVTIGQYLQPSKKHLPVKEFITPEQFEKYEKIGKELGFIHVESGPLVRSSYHAEKHIH